jgi:glycosyltransferase involved in cell wall biosynthesis
MRILQVVHGFPPDAWAGTELVTYHLAHALRARGHHVTVLTRIEQPGVNEFTFLPTQREGMDVVQVVNNYSRTTSLRLSYDNDFFTEPYLRLLERLQPDVVHFQHVVHLSVNLLPLTTELGYPTVLSLHDFFFACHLVHLLDRQGQICAGPEQGERCISCLGDIDSATEIRRRFTHMQQALQAPDVILTPSQFLTSKVRSYFPALGSRVRQVALGVKAIPPTKSNRLPGAPLRILYAGVLLAHKGAHVLLAALKGLPVAAFEVSLYGLVVPFWQSYVDELQKAAQGLPVRFCGAYPHGEVGSILARHDVLVMPGICEETFSLMTREALLAGLPVIAARRGALPEAIHDGENGLLFEAGNADDLRRCLARLLNEPDLLEHLRASQSQVKTVEVYAQDMEAVYSEICADSNRSRTLRQRLTSWRQEMNSLRSENQQCRAEREALQAQMLTLQKQHDQFEATKAALEHERDQALRNASNLAELLRARDSRVQEQEKYLNAIYASTTWKLYCCYVAIKEVVLRWPWRIWRRYVSKEGN